MSTEPIVGGIKQTEGSENSLEIETLAKFAVDEHNKKENALLEFQRVINTKEQVVAGTLYYITLEATDNDKKKVYEAKVWVKPWLNFKELQDFKYVGDADAPAEVSSS
ncbi:cysteine proteinase inhibitor A-like [Chenopodium quinoa]|uniref:cysteine proteinase inhibitor A-like n=1 Tax=Chenopodium quinoa TaxID=63459 RepID=UPI000B76CF55|nr:cysteine proteinase inhibitor A-like [Chenopodium quinoa]XP_021734281.1 cysteine proteinase inhibitor A-like [Chenopodium quinoa]